MLEPMPITNLPQAASDCAVVGQLASLEPIVRAVVACTLREHQNHPDVDDCAHEVFRRALEGHSRLRADTPLRAWVLGIAKHVAIDALRERSKFGRHLSFDESSVQDSDSRALSDRIADPALPVDDRLDDMANRQKLNNVIDSLPSAQRNALYLFHFDGLDYKQISEELGVPLGTVATWISRARKRIMEVLSPEGMTS